MTTLTKIGNSQGVRIPKPIIEQAKLADTQIELIVTKEGLLLKPVKNSAREKWEENIKTTLAKNSKDPGVIEEFLNEELEEWEW